MAAQTSMLHIRVDDDIKEQATAALTTMGLSVSDAVRLFLRRVVIDQAFPLELKVPNAETQAAMEESRAMMASRRHSESRFASADEMFADLEKKTAARKRAALPRAADYARAFLKRSFTTRCWARWVLRRGLPTGSAISTAARRARSASPRPSMASRLATAMAARSGLPCSRRSRAMPFMGRAGQRRHHLRRATRVSRRRGRSALPGLPARPGRQQNLRAAPACEIGHGRTSHSQPFIFSSWRHSGRDSVSFSVAPDLIACYSRRTGDTALFDQLVRGAARRGSCPVCEGQEPAHPPTRTYFLGAAFSVRVGLGGR